AILALAHRKPYPVMEANIRRLLSRLEALPQANEKQLWELAHTRLDHEYPYEYNQALMDIGSQICKPRNPICAQCPLTTYCKGKENQEAYPPSLKRSQPPIRRQWLILYQNQEGKVALTQRQGKFLHGLYGVPEVDS